MGKKAVAVGGGDGPNTIFKATYSGVPVYEMICNTIAVMRRRSDSYLNATQILKVAGFDKPQRTRVLEREVQKGEHEKVQGGYGKYQGTWVPIERGLALAKQYNVEDLLRPIIDYVPTAVSPPPAPKHIVAPPTKSKKDKAEGSAGPKGNQMRHDNGMTPSKTGPTSAAALQAQAQLAAQRVALGRAKEQERMREVTPEVEASGRLSGDESMSGSVEEDDTSSPTPSPIASGLGDSEYEEEQQQQHQQMMDVDGMMGNAYPSARKRNAADMMGEEYHDHDGHLRRARGQSAVHTPQASPRRMTMGIQDEAMTPEQYTDIILNYFISESSQIPSILISPPANFDANLRVDEESHTALHWACAMGRVRVVKLLLTAGASIFAPNNSEQTPLMRSVMFSNNYDVRKFPELYELLHRSTLNIDKHNRTVFHHISNLALAKGKAHAARYYMETILSRLSDFPQELADVINFQDEDGETALTLAARARSRRLVKALLDHGADPKIKNRDFKSAEDYILEDERFRSSPVQGASASYVNGKPVATTATNGLGDIAAFAPQLYNSEAARLTGGQFANDITAHMQSLARSFDSELATKERLILQAKAMLTGIHAEVTEASRSIASLKAQVEPLETKRAELGALGEELKGKISVDLKKGYEAWLAGQLDRENRWRTGDVHAGEDMSDLEQLWNVTSDGGAEEETLRWELEEKRRRRTQLVERFVAIQSEAGTDEKIASYRKLISAGCGGMAIEEVDGVMSQLLETLENETPQHGYQENEAVAWMA